MITSFVPLPWQQGNVAFEYSWKKLNGELQRCQNLQKRHYCAMLVVTLSYWRGCMSVGDLSLIPRKHKPKKYDVDTRSE